MKETSEITACVVDHGLFLPLALRLAKDFKRVLYHSPWTEAFPTINKCVIGDGFSQIERCDDFWPLKEDIDLFIFPDIYDSGLQLELESQGFHVWGSRTGDALEIYRQQFLHALVDVGLEVPRYQIIVGLEDLKQHLRDKTDQFIKISKYRGTMETTHWRDCQQDGPFLDLLGVKFGPLSESIRFLVFEPIKTDLEIGADTYSVDGQYPDTMIAGLEYKDKGYFGAVRPADEMPEQLQAVNEAFAAELKEKRYRNFISSEVRVVGDQFFFIDPTRRMPCPAGASQLALYSNLAEIITQGARGILVQPEMSAKFAAECVLTAKGERKTWRVVNFPEELLEHLACSCCCQVNGAFCWPPDDSHGEEIGWLVATGDTPRQTIETMLERVKLLPDGVCGRTEALGELLKELKSAETEGVPMLDQPVPEPSIVMEDE